MLQVSTLKSTQKYIRIRNRLINIIVNHGNKHVSERELSMTVDQEMMFAHLVQHFVK